MKASYRIKKSPTIGWRLAQNYLQVDRVHRICGGLGNQMFQYAHALALNNYFPARTFVDLCHYDMASPDRAYLLEDVFEIPDRFPRISAQSAKYIKFFRLDKTNRNEEYTIEYKPDFIGHDLRGIVQGYFPSFLYSEKNSDLIRRNFKFRLPLHPRHFSLLEEISSPDAVAVHVRRGDYLKPENINDFFGMCTPKYYRAAMNYIRIRIPNAKFYFFSDDPLWCQQEFASEACRVVDSNVGNDSWMDMALMSKCHHAIVANSSFSLWARWIRGFHSNSIEISPSRFLNAQAYGSRVGDIVPANFLLITEDGIVLENHKTN